MPVKTTNKAIQYAEDITSGKIAAPKWIRLAVKKHISDLKKAKRKDFPFIFDEDAADHALSVFSFFKFSYGQGKEKPFILSPWQAFILWVAYGWKVKSSGKRRYTKIFILVPRKNGKTEMLAGIGIYGQFFDEYAKDAEVVWFATKKNQARIGFDRQTSMSKLLCSDSVEFARHCRFTKQRIYSLTDLSRTMYLGRDKKEDGLSPSTGICDEYHSHETDEMMHVITSGMVGRSSPQMWIISTAGTNPNGPCARFQKTCEQVLLGKIPEAGILPFLWTLDDGDDWQDPKVWGKVNPNLNVSVDLDTLTAEYNKALAEGTAARSNFRTKNLNIWEKANQVWITDEAWMASGSNFKEKDLEGRVCFGGLDLASTSDLCSLALTFPPMAPDEPVKTLWCFWVPEENARKRDRTDGIPYLQWIDEGYLYATPGNVTDYEYIRKTLNELLSKFRIHSIGYDRYNSSQLVTQLIDDGFQMDPFGQGFISMSTPTKDLERLVLQGKYNHGNNPVLRWQCGNVSIRIDPAGNIKIDKAKSADKVDGMVAGVMALGQWNTYPDAVQQNSSPIIFL